MVQCRHFGHLSPGVRPFPKNAPIFQNNEYFRYLASFRGSYVDEGDRQWQKTFFPADLLKVLSFQKKGASIQLLPVEKQKIAQKYRRGY